MALFQFPSQTLFFSASSSQPSTASSVVFCQPATADESFHVPSEWVGSVSLPLQFYRQSWWQMFCCSCYYRCSSNSFSNSAAGLTLQTQGRMLRVHSASDHQMVFLHPGASQAITVPDLVNGTLGFVTRFCSVVQGTLELRSSLAQLPECWDFRCPDL